MAFRKRFGRKRRFRKRFKKSFRRYKQIGQKYDGQVKCKVITNNSFTYTTSGARNRGELFISWAQFGVSGALSAYPDDTAEFMSKAAMYQEYRITYLKIKY